MFRFTIRDVLWLTALAAVSIGWHLQRESLQHKTVRLEQVMREYEAGKQDLERAKVGYYDQIQKLRSGERISNWNTDDSNSENHESTDNRR